MGTTLFATSTRSGIEAYRVGVARVAADVPGDFNGDQAVDAADSPSLAA